MVAGLDVPVVLLIVVDLFVEVLVILVVVVEDDVAVEEVTDVVEAIVGFVVLGALDVVSNVVDERVRNDIVPTVDVTITLKEKQNK